MGNFCHDPITLVGAPCTALFDTGITPTLVRPGVVPAGTHLEATEVPGEGEWVKSERRLQQNKDGVLHRACKVPATGEERWQIMAPRNLREDVFRAFHGAAGAGHF